MRFFAMFVLCFLSASVHAQAPNFAGSWRLDMQLVQSNALTGALLTQSNHTVPFVLPSPMTVNVSTTVVPSSLPASTTAMVVYDATTGIASDVPGGYIQVWSESNKPGIFNLRIVYPTRDGVYEALAKLYGNNTRLTSTSVVLSGSMQGHFIPRSALEPTIALRSNSFTITRN